MISTAPENFYYFITIFSLSIGLGVYTLLSYHRSWLTYTNAMVFFLCGARAATEYILQHATSYEEALHISKYNGSIGQIFFTLTWILLYFHILPFKHFKYSKWIDRFVLVVLLIIPGVLITYGCYTRALFELNIQTLQGYWTFKPVDSLYTTVYAVYGYGLMGLFSISLMTYSIATEKANRIKKTAILLVFIYLMFSVNLKIQHVPDTVWKVSSLAFDMFIDALLYTYFVSGYRLIKDQFKDASSEILNSLSDLIIRTDKHLNVRLLNTAADQFWTSSDKNLPLSQLLSSDQEETTESKIKSLINLSRESIELNLKNEKGLSRQFVTKATPYIWRGKNEGYFFIFTDITELKQKEAQLEKANQTKDMLFSILAHDLRKPALSFRSIAKKINYLLSKRDFDGLDRLGHSIERSAISLNSLLDNLLNWSLSQKDMVSVRPRTIALKKLIKEVINMIEILAQEKNIKINDETAEDIVILTDPDILMTIIRNILDNAIKYTPKEGSINIKINDSIESTTITIRDTGVGMTPEKISNIRNQQNLISTTGTSGEKGSGMGISMVISLLNKLNGTLAIESTIDHGTTMHIQLRKSFDTAQSQLSANASHTKSIT